MLGWAIRQLGLWTAALVGLVLAVDALRAPPPTPSALAKPSAPASAPIATDASGRSTNIRSGTDGHFVAAADVDGTDVRFLVDTGASSVVLTPEDAERIGLRVSERDFTLVYHTANGTVRAAPVTLRHVRIGSLVVRDVEAAVNEVSIGISLLGMSFLSRLDGYQVQGNQLILYW